MTDWTTIGFKATAKQKLKFKKKCKRMGINQSIALKGFYHQFMSESYENPEEFNEITKLRKKIDELEEALKKSQDIQTQMNVNSPYNWNRIQKFFRFFVEKYGLSSLPKEKFPVEDQSYYSAIAYIKIIGA